MCNLTTNLSNGVPSRIKSRIIILGIRNTTLWASSDCYVPVISHVHLRLIISLAITHRRLLKQGDVKHAFCQANLPPTECIVVSPPPGCPFSKPGELWLLRKSLLVSTGHLATGRWRCRPPYPTLVSVLAPMHLVYTVDALLQTSLLSICLSTWTISSISLPAILSRENSKPSSTSPWR